MQVSREPEASAPGSKRARTKSQRSQHVVNVSRVVPKEHVAVEDLKRRGAELRRLIIKAACMRATAIRCQKLD